MPATPLACIAALALGSLLTGSHPLNQQSVAANNLFALKLKSGTVAHKPAVGNISSSLAGEKE